MIHRKASKRKIAFAKRMRRRLTRGERSFKQIAKELHKETGYRFWPQTVLLGWIVDFWCPKLKLVVEIDGKSHEKTESYDNLRELVMEDELGARTVRFSNGEVNNNPAIVKARMKRIIKQQISDS